MYGRSSNIQNDLFGRLPLDIEFKFKFKFIEFEFRTEFSCTIKILLNCIESGTSREANKMAVLSVLCRQFGPAVNGLKHQLNAAKNVSLVTAVRNMGGHGRRMTIIPTKHEVNVWKDKVHFFFALGIIPLGAVIVYANTFVGHGILTDIPENYEPKHWEFHKHPIKRFFARYVYSNPQKEYEKYLHFVFVEDQKAKWRKLEWKAKDLMRKRGDYKSWYYVPFNDRSVYLAHENLELNEERQGIQAQRID
ncbi:NADH dehydrogenase [ubiquinone] 1 beta subcomplex subunit 5, mitochondrial-like [Tubulanus polymorphus]|uniref:NADH dehydrogenase [ubiquinone] 1 beta subcomplex subunit 5, mitochondrial-like n=1 Tax=Tubulanus polymorphus TaxID=672921 RepID=UPI003DA1F146